MIAAITKISKSAIVDGFRLLVIKWLGGIPVNDVSDCSPSGIDSCPIPGQSGLFVKTDSGKQINIGYITKNKRAAAGEIYIYSVNSSGVIQTDIKVKSDATIEIGGNLRHFVAWEELNDVIQNLKVDMNSQFQSVINSHQHPFTGTIAVVGAGGTCAGTTGGTTVSSSPITIDLTPCKTTKIKTGLP